MQNPKLIRTFKGVKARLISQKGSVFSFLHFQKSMFYVKMAVLKSFGQIGRSKTQIKIAEATADGIKLSFETYM